MNTVLWLLITLNLYISVFYLCEMLQLFLHWLLCCRPHFWKLESMEESIIYPEIILLFGPRSERIVVLTLVLRFTVCYNRIMCYSLQSFLSLMTSSFPTDLKHLRNSLLLYPFYHYYGLYPISWLPLEILTAVHILVCLGSPSTVSITQVIFA